VVSLTRRLPRLAFALRDHWLAQTPVLLGRITMEAPRAAPIGNPLTLGAAQLKALRVTFAGESTFILTGSAECADALWGVLRALGSASAALGPTRVAGSVRSCLTARLEIALRRFTMHHER